MDVPTSAETSVHREWLLVQLREDWTPVPGGPTHPAGSMLATVLEDWLAGSRDLTVLFTPTPSTSLAGLSWTRHRLVMSVLHDVRTEVHVLTPPEPAAAGTRWATVPLPGLAELVTVGTRAVDRIESDAIWLVTTGFATPPTLAVQELGTAGEPAPPEPLKAAPTFFDATGIEVTQHFATSDDGTRVPYFLVRGPQARTDGTAPTLLYGYGGFEISLLPAYSGTLGRTWLSRGGVYALANIRGGGEYGPGWHQAALRENRHRAYEDFAAVARDLVATGVTTPEHLGVQGGSNGGLLTGNVLTQYPELVGAVVIQVPLAGHEALLAPARRRVVDGRVRRPGRPAGLGVHPGLLAVPPARRRPDYPPVLLTTSTRDDRVHPGHARKMAAWLRDHGKDVTYYENVEGGHGGAADNSQAAFMSALAFEFLAERLG